MAWAYVGSADLTNNGAAAGAWTSSNTYTVTGGATALLRVVIWGPTGADTVSGGTVKWGGSGGQAMTLVGSIQPSGGWFNYEYFLLNPGAGSGALYISPTGDGWLGAEVAEYSGIQQSSQPDGAASTATGTTVASAAVTPSASGNLIGIAGGGGGGAISAGTGTTSRALGIQYGNSLIGDSGAAAVTGSSPYTAEINNTAGVCSIVVTSYTLDGGGGAAGQPTTKRFGGVPHMGSGGLKGNFGGGPWGRTTDHIYVPRWLANERQAA